MNRFTRSTATTLAAGLALGFVGLASSGCDDKPTAVEKAADKIEDAADKTADAAEDAADDAADAVDDAADKVKDATDGE